MQWSLLLLREMSNWLQCRKWRLSTMRLRAGCVFDHAHLESEMDGTSMQMLCVYLACLLYPAIVKRTDFSCSRTPITYKIHIYLHVVSSVVILCCFSCFHSANKQSHQTSVGLFSMRWCYWTKKFMHYTNKFNPFSFQTPSYATTNSYRCARHPGALSYNDELHDVM